MIGSRINDRIIHLILFHIICVADFGVSLLEERQWSSFTQPKACYYFINELKMLAKCKIAFADKKAGWIKKGRHNNKKNNIMKLFFFISCCYRLYQ